MSDKEEQLDDSEILVEEKPVYCWACGDELRGTSLLVCAECLNYECTKFAELAKTSSKK